MSLDIVMQFGQELLLTDRRFTTRYYEFLGGNIISWKSKKQSVVARSTVEAKYRVITSLTCELISV